MAAANEQIGIAMAAFYPQSDAERRRSVWKPAVCANGSPGRAASGRWDRRSRRPCSTRAAARAVVAEQRAAYDATVATYRQTVLTALQQVEDNLAALRILEGEAAKVQDTIQAATRALSVSTAQYKAGTAELPDGNSRAGHAADRPADPSQPAQPPSNRQRPADRGAGRRLGHLQVAGPQRRDRHFAIIDIVFRTVTRQPLLSRACQQAARPCRCYTSIR